MEGVGEEAEDLLWAAQVVEDDVMRQDVEGLDQLEDRQTESSDVYSSSMSWLLLCVLILHFLLIFVIFRAVDEGDVCVPEQPGLQGC